MFVNRSRIVRYRIIENPIRPFAIMEDETGSLRAMWPDDEGWRALEHASADQTWQPDLAATLARYFAGEHVDFAEVPTPAGPAFFHRCWAACRSIPRGQTRSYRALAEMAGSDAGASRAAGQAMRNNPLPVIVPCHRVLAASGRLHGFAGSTDPLGGELAVKRALLALEGAPAAATAETLF